MTERGETRYARNGDVHLAFQAVGEGELDLLLVDTWVHHVEAVWEFGDYARFLRRLSAFGRLIHFDRRGTGLSDRCRPTSSPTSRRRSTTPSRYSTRPARARQP
ncbi:MAG: hypothetical protein ACXWZD_11505 [Actinomycetota bacterium]